ncbi:MAG: aminotransferase class IV [Actinomycetes bacterium]
MKCWINDRLVDVADARISVLDHGLTVGDGVFETAKVVDGIPFAMTRHLKRLAESCLAMGLPTPDLDLVRTAVAAVLAADAAEVGPIGRLRITYTGGPGPLGTDRSGAEPTLLVAMSAGKAWPASAAVVTVPWPRNERGATAGIKSTSYAENIIALAYAHQREATEAIFANTIGNLCEGTGSNIFVVVDGELITPPLMSGCLAGVTRGLVIEWNGAEERDLPVTILTSAAEVFLASSTRDIQPVHRVDDRNIDVPGPITAMIAANFAARSVGDPDPI